MSKHLKKETASCNRIKNDIKHYESLLGYIRGILADDVVQEKEIESMIAFMEKNPDLKKGYPGDIIFETCCKFLRNDMQGMSIVTFFKEITSDNIEDSARFPIDKEVNEIFFENKKFCFTGIFQIGTRALCHKIIETLGGVTSSTVTTDIDYLIIGHYSSPDWVNTSSGRKIEKAMSLKKTTGLKIIGEAFWAEELDRINKTRKAS